MALSRHAGRFLSASTPVWRSNAWAIVDWESLSWENESVNLTRQDEDGDLALSPLELAGRATEELPPRGGF